MYATFSVFCIIFNAAAMMNSDRSTTRIAALSLLLFSLLNRACAFLPHVTRTTLPALSMGLYDTPLPPPLPPKDDEQPPDDEYLDGNIAHLFNMLPDGREARDLLPRLGRSLESGVECYFEVTDRKVQNLVEKTGCHAMDAAWALEACQGDTQEAWLQISTARRMLLNNQDEEDWEEDDWDAELFSTLKQNEEVILDDETFPERKERMALEEKERKKKQAIEDLWDRGEPDQPWLPTKNPNPVDDEPWFTG